MLQALYKIYKGRMSTMRIKLTRAVNRKWTPQVNSVELIHGFQCVRECCTAGCFSDTVHCCDKRHTFSLWSG